MVVLILFLVKWRCNGYIIPDYDLKLVAMFEVKLKANKHKRLKHWKNTWSILCRRYLIMYCSHQEKIWANAQDITFLKAIRGQTHEKPECHEHCSTSMCLIRFCHETRWSGQHQEVFKKLKQFNS